VNHDYRGGVAQPGEYTNTDDARRKFKYLNGFLTLQDGRQLYVKHDCWSYAFLPGENENNDDRRRIWKFANKNVRPDNYSERLKANVLYDSKQFYVVKEDTISIVSNKLDAITHKEDFDYSSFNGTKEK
jgi:hypothetical protein